jgi:pimeloyl-ACP methyl ester carboxylesterase
MIARVLRPELEDMNLRNQTTTARLTWQPRGYDPHLAKWLHRIKLPTLLVWGANDVYLPPAYAAAWQKLIADAQLVVIPDCGHLPHVEQPAAFVAALEKFFDRMRVPA